MPFAARSSASSVYSMPSSMRSSATNFTEQAMSRLDRLEQVSGGTAIDDFFGLALGACRHWSKSADVVQMQRRSWMLCAELLTKG